MRGIIETGIGAGIGALLAIVLAEWFVGCGESYVDAEGIIRVGECLFFR